MAKVYKVTRTTRDSKGRTTHTSITYRSGSKSYSTLSQARSASRRSARGSSAPSRREIASLREGETLGYGQQSISGKVKETTYKRTKGKIRRSSRTYSTRGAPAQIAPVQPTIKTQVIKKPIDKSSVRYSPMQRMSQLRTFKGQATAIRGAAGIPEEKVITAKKKYGEVIAKPKKYYESAEAIAREKVTYPVAEKFKKYKYEPFSKETTYKHKQVLFKTPAPIDMGLEFKKPKVQRAYEKTLDVESSYLRGYAGGLKEKPLKTAAYTAAFFALPPAIKGMGTAAKITGVASLAIKYPKATKIVGKGLTYGLPALYGGVVGYRVAKAPKGEKVEKFGEISATEMTPMVVGGYAGAKFWPRISTWFQRGGERLPPQVEAKIKATEGIPSAPVKEHYKMFVSKKYAPKGTQKPVGYHLTSGELLGKYKTPTGQERIKVLTTKELKELGLKVKSREAVGMYIAPYPSVHFARITKDPSLYGGKFFEPYKKPSGLVVEPLKFKEAPIVKKITKFGKIEKIIKVKRGVAGVPAKYITKKEPQAIIPPPTELKKTKEVYHFWYRGYKVAMPKFKAISSEGVSLVKTGFKTSMKRIVPLSISSYKGGASYITTPSSFGLASYLGRRRKSTRAYTYGSGSIGTPISPTPPIRISQPSRIISIKKYTPPSPAYPSKGFPSTPSLPAYPSLAPPSYPTPSSPAYPSLVPPSIPVTGKGFLFPKLDMFSGIDRYKKKKEYRKFRYTPSPIALAFGIKGKKPKPLTIKAGGIRPILIKKKGGKANGFW